MAGFPVAVAASSATGIPGHQPYTAKGEHIRILPGHDSLRLQPGRRSFANVQGSPRDAHPVPRADPASKGGGLGIWNSSRWLQYSVLIDCAPCGPTHLHGTNVEVGPHLPIRGRHIASLALVCLTLFPPQGPRVTRAIYECAGANMTCPAAARKKSSDSAAHRAFSAHFVLLSPRGLVFEVLKKKNRRFPTILSDRSLLFTNSSP